ncbi:hypothetical protein [Streptomyces syringium]|uniref:hypothetical protein n=1 Tax=Streptomyces syringium TaxID=76729 RepID=UPI003431A109
MSKRQRKGRVAAVLGGALALALPLVAQLAHADQEAVVAVAHAHQDDPPDADPCAGDKPGTACGGAQEKDPCNTPEGSEKPQACGGVTDNRSEMQRCQPKITTDHSCLDEVATDGKREKDLINGQEAKIGQFNDRKREADPARAVDDACSTPLSGLPPFKKDHYVFLPTGCEPSP